MSLSWVFQVFISLIVIMNPFGLLPVFLRLTDGVYNDEEKKSLIRKACVIGGSALYMFAFFGSPFFRAIDVPTCALRIFGGLLLLLNSIDMIVIKQSRFTNPTSSEEREAVRQTDIAVFPLAIPLIAGPGSCASVIVLTETANRQQFIVIISMLLFILSLVYLTLNYASKIKEIMGITITNSFVRISGIILGGIASTSILNGINDFIGLKVAL